MLTLNEKFLLLALKGEKGSIPAGYISYGLAGALLMDLIFLKRIDIVKKKVIILDTTKTDDDLLNEALSVLSQSRKEKTAEYWITKLASKIKSLWKRVADTLLDKGIVQKQQIKILGLFPATRYPVLAAETKDSLISDLKTAVFSEEQPDDDMVALICLSSACSILRPFFESDERREVSKRVKKMLKEHPVGRAVAAAIAAMQAATNAIISSS